MVRRIPQKHGGCIQNFEKGESGNLKGKPKLTIRRIVDELRAEGYELANRQDVEALYIQLPSLPEERVRELAVDETQPLIVRIVARELLGWDDPFNTIERILDRAVGKPTQKTEATIDAKLDMTTPVKDMTDEQIDQELQK